MFSLIIKNIWARRKRNGWLFAEFVAVAIVLWVILDPVIVGLYVRSLPVGYDVDRLCSISLGRYYEGTPGYSIEADSALFDDIDRIMYQARTLPDVESSTQLMGFSYPGASGVSMSSYVNPNDTIKELFVFNMFYTPRTDFFKTFGIQPAEGYTVEQLEEAVLDSNSLLMSENAVNELFGEERSNLRVNWPPRYLKYTPDAPDKEIVGIFKPIKLYNGFRTVPIAFEKFDKDNYFGANIPAESFILIRLKKGVDMDMFIENFNNSLVRQLHSGNLYACGITEYSEVLHSLEKYNINQLRIKYVFASFFLICLCLGVIGAFWLQTKVRKKDVGVMLSFGGTPNYIMCMLMGEGVLLTTIAVIIGCLIYLQYGFMEGLANDYLGDMLNVNTVLMGSSWIDNFPLHFIIVSGIIWVLMMIVVLIGIYIPARNISRILPAEALRDE